MKLRLAVATAAAVAAVAAAADRAAAAVPWCGVPARAAADLSPDGTGFEWHVVYAHPSDRTNRFVEWAPRIAGDAAVVDAWWRRQDPTRRPRWDLESSFACASEFGRLDVSSVSLPRGSAYYTHPALVADVVGPGARLFHADKAFLIYMDGGGPSGVCGQATLGPDEGPLGFAVVYVDACGSSTDDAGRASVGAHEMVHAMGGTAGSANVCPTDPGHVCDTSLDILWPFHVGHGLDALALDVGRDDYYGHAGTWWDVDGSLLLHRLDDADQAAPTAPANLTATSDGTEVRLTWGHASDAVGPIWYRIYNASGSYLETRSLTDFVTSAEVGAVVAYRVRAMDAVGFLSPSVSIRFRVGYGIVDDQDRLVRDTVPPSPVTGLTVRRAGSRAVVRWRPATDLVGLRGYRVAVGGVRAAFVTGTTASLPFARVRGRLVTVEAVDGGGNAGRAAARVAPRR